ncbi:MAG: sugar ABC transporter permease [Roseibium sp.]|uniref:carbohydrate ABC transporter permease n=1 Tax=Roseibium sp. TaxID=1936156 RepID=UPI002622303D|nr:sugar ABC transporter permease [Roseibium sp.]MCV0423933.1 sugar ABC transporter permease [Roseibium sp.]
MRTNSTAWLFLTPAAALLVVIGFAPLMTMVNYSVQDSFAGDRFFWVGSEWYEEAFRSPAFWGALGRTVLFAIISLSIQFGLGIYIARKLFHVQKHGAAFLGILALPLLTPWIVVGFVWRHAMDAEAGILGALGSVVAIVPDLNSVTWVWATIIIMDVWHWTSFTVILCYAGYVSIPGPFFQAAQIDGASTWAVFRFIELPKLKRVLTVALLLRIADSLMINTEPQMISRGGPHVSSTFFSQELIKTAMQEFNLGEAGALSVIYLLLVVPISWGLYRLMRGSNGV